MISMKKLTVLRFWGFPDGWIFFPTVDNVSLMMFYGRPIVNTLSVEGEYDGELPRYTLYF